MAKVSRHFMVHSRKKLHPYPKILGHRSAQPAGRDLWVRARQPQPKSTAGLADCEGPVTSRRFAFSKRSFCKFAFILRPAGICFSRWLDISANDLSCALKKDALHILWRRHQTLVSRKTMMICTLGFGLSSFEFAAAILLRKLYFSRSLHSREALTYCFI